MDVKETPPSDSLQQSYGDIAQKTTEAIATEESPEAIYNEERIQTYPLQPAPPAPPPPPPQPQLQPREPRMCCRMFFPTSGHMGWDTVKTSDELPPIDIVRQMILYETRLRLSDAVQNVMDQYYTDESAVT